MKLDVGEADLSSYRTFAVDIFFAEDFESGSLTVAFIKIRPTKRDLNIPFPVNLQRAKPALLSEKRR